MDNYKITFTRTARRDIENIYNYICYNLKSKITADRILDKLEYTVGTLSYMPFRHKIYDREPWKSRNLRVLPVDNYIVFYIPDNSQKNVNIITIL